MSDLLGELMRRVAARTSVVLCYHGVAPRRQGTDPFFLQVEPALFRRQVELLVRSGFRLVTVAELAELADGGTPPPGLAAISFDDGMQDNHSTALPILRELGAHATVYVTTGMVGQPNPWVEEGSRLMTEDELREVYASGWELGAHSVTHPDMSLLSKAACLREMTESREWLERLTGMPVRTFAYPFCNYGEAAREAAREAGFIAAVTCHAQGSWDPLEMKRTMITGKDGMPSFVLKVAGVYEPLFHSAAGRAVRAATRAARARARALLERRA